MESTKRLISVLTVIGMIATLFAGLTLTASAEITGTVISEDKAWNFSSDAAWNGASLPDVFAAGVDSKGNAEYTLAAEGEYDGITVSGTSKLQGSSKTFVNSRVFAADEKTAWRYRIDTNTVSFNVAGPCIIAVDYAGTGAGERGFNPMVNGRTITPITYAYTDVDTAVFAYTGTEAAKIDLVPTAGISLYGISVDFGPEYLPANTDFAAAIAQNNPVNATAEHGSYTLSKNEAKYGEIVRVGVMATTGYVYAEDSLNVTYQDGVGNEVSVNLTEVAAENGEAQAFEFIMPETAVTVTSEISEAVFNDIEVLSSVMGGKIVFSCDEDPSAVEKVSDTHYRAIAGKIITVSFDGVDDPLFAGYIYKVGSLELTADGLSVPINGEYDADKITFVMPGKTVNAFAEFCPGTVSNAFTWVFGRDDGPLLTGEISTDLTLEGGLKVHASPELTYKMDSKALNVIDTDGELISASTYLRLQGTGRFDENGNPTAGVLEFTPTRPCRVSAVIVSSNSQGEERQLNIAQGGKLIGQISTESEGAIDDLSNPNISVVVDRVNEPMYIYSEYSHIRLYALRIEYLNDVEPAAMTGVDGQFSQSNTPIKRFIYFNPDSASGDSRPGTQTIKLSAWSQDKTTPITGRLVVIQKDNDGNIVDVHISEEKTGITISEEVPIKLATAEDPTGLPCDIEGGDWSSTKYDIEGYIWDSFDNIRPLTENQSVFKYNTDYLYESAE